MSNYESLESRRRMSLTRPFRTLNIGTARPVAPVNLSRLVYQLPSAANWQTVIDIFRQRTKLAFAPDASTTVCSDSQHPARYEDQDPNRLFIIGWDRQEPYDDTSPFVQYVLQFRYTPIHQCVHELGFFEQSFLLLESLFLSPNLPALQIELLEEGIPFSR